MMCIMQNHLIQAFANSGNAIKPVSFIRDLKSKDGSPPTASLPQPRSPALTNARAEPLRAGQVLAASSSEMSH